MTMFLEDFLKDPVPVLKMFLPVKLAENFGWDHCFFCSGLRRRVPLDKRT